VTHTPGQPPDTPTSTDAEADAAASRLVAACEHAWRAIQARHPWVPDTVIILGTGVEHGRLVKLGHWWGGQWRVGTQARGEVLLAGEALHLPPEAVFEVLLHEAAHGLNAGRGIRDTSRGGRYHNTRFKETADEVGLRPRRMDPYGWARTELTPATTEIYAEAIGRIGAEMRLARSLPARRGVGLEGGSGITEGETPPVQGGERERRARQRPAECGCAPPRKMRMAPSVLARGPVMCGICAETFDLDRSPEARPLAAEPAAARGVVEDSFLARRRDALAFDGAPIDVVDAAQAYLNRIEAVFAQAAPRLDQGDLILQVFREAKADIAAWFDDVITADVVPLPGATAPDRHASEHGGAPPSTTLADREPVGPHPPAALLPEPPIPELRP
jgi:hypothetical protein